MNVCVVIPAYLPSKQHIDFLTRSVESVQKQSYDNIKTIIVFNGCSPIGYDNVKSLVIKNKCSAAIARNVGASYCIESDYICFLDSDDLYEEKKIELQLNYCIKNNTDFCFTESIKVDKENKVIENYSYHNNCFTTEHIKAVLPNENILVTSSSMIKTSSFFECGMFCPSIEYNITNNGKHHNEKNCVFEDYYLWQNALNKGYNFSKMPLFLTRYRVNSSVER